MPRGGSPAWLANELEGPMWVDRPSEFVCAFKVEHVGMNAHDFANFPCRQGLPPHGFPLCMMS